MMTVFMYACFFHSDEEELRKSFSELADSRTDSASHTMKQISSGGNPLVSLAQQSSAQVYRVNIHL